MAKGTASARMSKLHSKGVDSHKMRNQKKTSAFKRSNASTNPHRIDKDKGKGNMRSRATINRLNMYTEKPDMDAMRKRPTDPHAGKIEPDRRWYGNTRVLDQKELHKYMDALDHQVQKRGSGHSILIKGRQLPLSLLKNSDLKGQGQMKLLNLESY